MTWGCVDFERENFRITKSKNSEPRTVPLFPSLRALLLRIRRAQGPLATYQSPLVSIRSAMTALKSACKELGFPDFTHHSLRHFFCSNAIEAGVDFKTIAGWLGHKDGGMLVARTYGHLRDEHSAQMAKRMTYDASESMQRSDNAP